MSYTVSVDRVRDGFLTSASDVEIAVLISFADGADSCMTAKSVPDDVGIQLKVYLLRHILSVGEFNGRGQIIQESAPSGASRAFMARVKNDTSSFMTMLDQLDRWGCVKKLMRRGGAAFIRGVGP